MVTIDMQAIVAKSEELNNDIENLKRELKRIASVKCRLKNMPGKSTYNEEMSLVLQEEELLKCVRSYLTGPRKNINTTTQEEVDKMTMDETMRALKAIQSKKTHTKWLTSEPGNNDEYREACRIENMLKAHRDAITPKELGMMYKTTLLKFLESLALCNDLTTESCIERLREYIEEA